MPVLPSYRSLAILTMMITLISEISLSSVIWLAGIPSVKSERKNERCGGYKDRNNIARRFHLCQRNKTIRLLIIIMSKSKMLAQKFFFKQVHLKGYSNLTTGFSELVIEKSFIQLMRSQQRKLKN